MADVAVHFYCSHIQSYIPSLSRALLQNRPSVKPSVSTPNKFMWSSPTLLFLSLYYSPLLNRCLLLFSLHNETGSRPQSRCSFTSKYSKSTVNPLVTIPGSSWELDRGIHGAGNGERSSHSKTYRRPVDE